LVAGCNSERSKSKEKEVKEVEAVMVKPPVAEKIPYIIETHGIKREDPYYWMRLSDDQKENEKPDDQTQRVLSYLEAENSYTKSILKPTEKLQDKLFKEIIGMIKEDDSTVPHLDN